MAGGWTKQATALADWAWSRAVVREDVYGAYTADGGQYTAHAPLIRELLIDHFRGVRTIGTHSISTDGRCKCFSGDIDAHDGDKRADPERNWRCALAVVPILAEFKLGTLILDSNGKGGYHARTFFKKPVPSDVAFWLGSQLNARLAAEGFPPIETFPKQGELNIDTPFGNWIRLPGKHPKRYHWTSVYDPEIGEWLSGEPAACRLIKVAGDDPKALLEAYEAAQKAAPGANGATGRNGTARRREHQDRPPEGKVREALGYLPNDDDHYDRWLAVGMALNDWDPSSGLALWLDYSARSHKHDEATCRAKWASFAPGGGLTIGSIFKAAMDQGWKPAAERARADGKNRVEPTGDEEDNSGVRDNWPTILEAAFHGVIGEIVKTTDPHSEADRVATMAQFLVALGNLLGRRPHFVVGATRHHLNLFAALVGLTALGRKGTSWDIVLWLLAMFDHEWADLCIKSGMVSGEGVIFHVRDASERLEGKKKVPDPGISDKRLLIVETELSRPLKAMNRENNTLSDVLRQSWDSGDLRSLAKNSPVKATGAHISIVAHTTATDVRRHLTETDSANGFGNRFLWIAVRRSKELPDGGNLTSVNWAPIQRRMAEIVTFGRQCGEMTRDPGARELWHAVYSELSAGKPGLLGAILSRAEAQTMRLACLYALLDQADVVRSEHLAAALALWDYCRQSARLVFGAALGNPDAEKLLDALRGLPSGLTRTQINSDVFGKHMAKKDIDALLSKLWTDGLIHKVSIPTAGRPAERWLYGRGGSNGVAN